ncbi:MAG: helix-turn-helix transcriptional regulator, partial [Kiritimatiellae bacterium]|nr:helix-turn-helix transcriptional regulator [Kiritimatiellia bacterium]
SMFLRELLSILRLKNEVGLRSIGELDPRVSACIQNIRNAPPGKLLTEEAMAEKVGISIGHLNRLFREQVGMSPHTLRDNRRYELARQRLDNQESIKEVAYSLGFSSPQHFSMWFKKRSKYTPRQFQQRMPQS